MPNDLLRGGRGVVVASKIRRTALGAEVNDDLVAIDLGVEGSPGLIIAAVAGGVTGGGVAASDKGLMGADRLNVSGAVGVVGVTVLANKLLGTIEDGTIDRGGNQGSLLALVMHSWTIPCEFLLLQLAKRRH